MPTCDHALSQEMIQKLLDIGVLQFNLKTNSLRISPNAETLAWEESLGFEHVAIRQKKNLNKSRLDVNTTSEIIKGVHRPIPMIAANMSTVTNAEFCIQLYKLGAFGILHRAAPEDYLCNEMRKIAEECKWAAGSIGVGEASLPMARKLIDNGCNILVIDIAHGYSDSVINIARKLKDLAPDIKLVVGNTTNIGLLLEAKDVIDALKVGIAQGAACETKNTAGCTEKQFSATLKFKHLSKELGIPIISDGGIREPADFTKAVAAGANSVMAGSVFARCPESAAEVLHKDGNPKKIYAGMASRYVQEKWRGGLKDGTCPEGGVRLLDLGEPLESLLKRWSGALKSGITYAGGNDIPSFQNTVEFLKLKS
jgi:IMP dehydrogenase